MNRKNKRAGLVMGLILVPLAGMTAEAWVQRNLERVPATKLSTISTRMTPDQAAADEFTAIVQENARLMDNYMLFIYKTAERDTPDLIMLAW
ncbi:MAG: hypothetical protein LBC51_02100 [Treponema sp.]|jgi:hypothetical protein|nr:hypothetical protein [Treponema sp.]